MTADFYIAQSKWSDPGCFKDVVAGWETDLIGMSHSICRLLRHPRGGTPGEAPFSERQQRDLLLRSASDLLDAAQDRRARDAGHDPCKRVGAVCRDFALLAAAAFRDRGTPSRLRVGFADYLVPGFYEDHWVCEYHDGGCWRRLDVEMAAQRARGAALPFDPTDVPNKNFIVAADAWCLVADGHLSPALFGVSSLGLQGLWFLAANLFRDEAALMRLELKPWDSWGEAARATRMDDRDIARSDTFRAAARRLGGVARDDGPERCRGYEDWVGPDWVMSYPFGDPIMVRVV